jgi:hypothetical protein
MTLGELGRRLRRWAVRYRARRRALQAAIRRPDEFLVEQAHRARDNGASYDSWRRSLPDIRQGGGGIVGGGGS